MDKSHSKEIGGTGLGLSIVKHGAAFHGATVQLDSELGMGTKANPTVAFECYKKAAERREPQAMLKLGACYLNGVGTAVDREQARKWLAEAAKQGSQEALQLLEKNFPQKP